MFSYLFLIGKWYLPDPKSYINWLFSDFENLTPIYWDKSLIISVIVPW